MLLCQSDELRMSYRWDIDKPVHPAWRIISVKDCWDQDSSIPCANALEILQSCSKQLICSNVKVVSYRWDTANTVHPAWMIMSVRDCLDQDSSICSANALEILQSCAKLLICSYSDKLQVRHWQPGPTSMKDYVSKRLLNTLRPRQDGRQFADDIFKCADQATSHYLNRGWKVYWRIYASLSLNELNPIQQYLQC